MSCTNCFDGCGTPMPDDCVRYTGANVPLLGISTGDPISKVEASIIAKLEEFAVGQGITLSSIDLKCDYLKTLFGCCQDKTLVNLIQLLVDSNCTLKALIDTLYQDAVPTFSFSTGCLTGLPATPTRDDILQALLVKVCGMDVTVNLIYGDYVKASQLNSLISSYLSSVSPSVQQNTKMVPYVCYEYYGSMANFDSTGKGLSSVGFDKVYVCNGSNGTPDKRGRVAVGAIQGVPAGTVALDSAVDPSLPANAGTNYSIKQKFGQSFTTLSVAQMPAHTHTATDSGHVHGLNASTNVSLLGIGAVAGTDPGGVKSAGSSATGFANITISSTGNSSAHENRQPSIGAYYIMYIP
jgi:hypothetical protein